MREKLLYIFQQLSLRVLFAALTFLIALYIFVLVTDEIFIDKEEEFDHAMFHFLHDDLTPGLIRVARFFTFFGKPDFLVPAYLLLIFYFVLRQKKQYAIETAIMGGSSTILLFGLKALFQRQRPDFPVLKELSGFSFPSGHALLMFVFCSMLIYIVWNSHMQRKWKWTFAIIFLLFSLIVGISRIVLRVHYASDVLAGFCLGYAWVVFGLWVQRRYLNHKKLLISLNEVKEPSTA
ncbi:MAG TPA: phosphatase PAP2 family protein [Chitinophagaceae bacterium]